MNKREKYSGMLLILKKRMKCIPRGDFPQFKIFGHYDALDIHLIEEWYQMRPQGVKSREGNISLIDDYRDKYTLKVYFPDEKKQQKLSMPASTKKAKMDYQLWKLISTGKDLSDMEKRSEYESICSQYPFLSLVFLNISEPMAQQEGELLELIGSCIIDAANKAKIQMSEVHGALFPSLGFCDYVLLFLSNNPGQIMSLLDYLKEEKVPGQTTPVISNFYPITGFEASGLGNLRNLQISNVEISVRINLQEGVSNRLFREELWKALPDEMKESGMFPLFGNSDCLWMPNVPFQDCIKLYYGKAVFSPDSNFYKKYICHMHSSIRINNSAISGDVQQDVNDSELFEWHIKRKNRLEAYKDQFKVLIDRLEKAAEEFKVPIRTVYGIQNVMKMFLDLIRSSHCFDLEVVLGKMFTALDKNIEYNLCIIDGLVDKERENSIHDLWNALDIFRGSVGTYLSDMQRSDRSFIESHSLVHQSIGSSTKLLLFYNRFIMEVTKKLVDKEEDNKNQTYTFLVTSGGTDKTEATDIFSHLDPTEEGAAAVVVLSVPEMSLYDIRGTMFRLMHECLHFCGERKRKKRYHRVIEALSSFSAMYFIRLFMMDIKKAFQDRVCFNLAHMFSDDILEDIRNKWKKSVSKEAAKEEKKLQKYIFDAFCYEMEMNPADYYSRYLYEFINVVAERAVFKPEVPRGECGKRHSDLNGTLYETLMNLRMYSASKATEILRKRPTKIPFNNSHFIENVIKEKIHLCKQGTYCVNDELFINACIQDFMGECVTNPYFELETEDIVKFSGVLKTLELLFKECFADCVAATILNGNITDVVMSIVYETWDIHRAFPDTHFEKFRRMVEKDLFDGTKEILEEEIQDKVECWKINGYDSPACQNEEDKIKLCQKGLGENDDNEENYEELLNPVKKYLKECIAIFQKDISNFEKEQKIFQYAAFQNERDLQMLLDEINSSWSQYSRENKSC